MGIESYREKSRRRNWGGHSHRSAGTPGGYRGRSRSRTGTASLYTHLMVRNPREDAPRALRWLRMPVAMREGANGE